MLGRHTVRAFVAAWGFVVLGNAACATATGSDPGKLSDDSRFASEWILFNADNHGEPFAIVDKKAARLHLFTADGQAAGSTPVLLGLAPGDASVPGIAKRRPASLAPSERTTPAGRYESVPGHNDKGEDIVWIDYDASLAIHRLRPSPKAEHRPERMASARAADKRISFGCVVVPVAFYETAIQPLLGRHAGVVYVLPETRPVRSMFDAYQLSSRTP